MEQPIAVSDSAVSDCYIILLKKIKNGLSWSAQSVIRANHYELSKAWSILLFVYFTSFCVQSPDSDTSLWELNQMISLFWQSLWVTKVEKTNSLKWWCVHDEDGEDGEDGSDDSDGSWIPFFLLWTCSDDSMGYQYPFTLRVVGKDGNSCAWCPWYR